MIGQWDFYFESEIRIAFLFGIDRTMIVGYLLTDFRVCFTANSIELFYNFSLVLIFSDKLFLFFSNYPSFLIQTKDRYL